MNEFRAVRCGTCGYAFALEEELRTHQKIPDEDGDMHDGEPWFWVTLTVGDELIWEEGRRQEHPIEVTAIAENSEGDIWVESTGQRGKYWNELARFVEATTPPYDPNSFPQKVDTPPTPR